MLEVFFNRYTSLKLRRYFLSRLVVLIVDLPFVSKFFCTWRQNKARISEASLLWLLRGILADATFLVAVAIALLRKRLRAVGASEGLHRVVRAHVILHIAHLPEHFQANFALSSLVLPAGFLIEDHHGPPEFFLADRLFFTKECRGETCGFDGARACRAGVVAGAL